MVNDTYSEKLSDGAVVTVRPINRDDVEREKAFVEGLSPESRHDRFLGGIGHMTESQLRKFCDIDRHHEMAFVALVKAGPADVQVGVARYVADPDNSEAEIAIAVADRMKGKGLDRILLNHLIRYARNFGIARLYSVEFASNAEIHNLLRQLGFDAVRDPEDGTQMIYSIDLSKNA